MPPQSLDGLIERLAQSIGFAEEGAATVAVGSAGEAGGDAVGAEVGVGGAEVVDAATIGVFAVGRRHPSGVHIPPSVIQETLSSCRRSASVELSGGAGGCASGAALVPQAVKISTAVAMSTLHRVVRVNRNLFFRMFN